jgi:hypothetical protein
MVISAQVADSNPDTPALSFAITNKTMTFLPGVMTKRIKEKFSRIQAELQRMPSDTGTVELGVAYLLGTVLKQAKENAHQG